MPQHTSLARFDSPIVFMQPLPFPKVGMISLDNTIYVYDLQTREMTKIFRPNIASESTLYGSFDPCHHRFLFGTESSHLLNVVDLDEKKVIMQFDLDQQFPTLVAFSPDGGHCVCGTDQGRVLLWRNDSSTLIARLHSFPEYNSSSAKPKTNYVSALTFSDMTLASSGYGGSIVLTDYISQTFSKRYTPSYMKNTALLLHNDSLIAGNQEGTLIKIDLHGKRPNQRLGTAHKNVRYLLHVGPDPYVIVGSELPYLTLINGDTLKVIQERYVDLGSPISALCPIDNYLLVTTSCGSLWRVDLQPFEHLRQLIQDQEYDAAYACCTDDPLLLDSTLYKTLEETFADRMHHAKIYLNQKMTAEAKALLEPFTIAKSREIAELFKTYALLDRFTLLYEQQKFSSLYGYAEQYPLLQETPIYQKVEKFWGERFTKAQKLMLLNKEKEIHEELRLFATVSSKRPFILLVLHNSAILISYMKAIQTKNYAQLKNITQHFPLLRKFPSYINLIQETGEMIGAIIKAINTRSFEQAELLLQELKEAVQYESEYRQLKKLHSLAQKLHHALKNDQLRSAYHLIDQYPELLTLPWGEELNEKWRQKLAMGEYYAIRGDVPSIKKEFAGLINLPNRQARLGDILRTAYHVQLKKLLKTDPEKFSSGIFAYCDLFGIDTELRNLLKKAQRKEIVPDLTQTHLTPKNRDYWASHISSLPTKIAG
jgi:hypothetical protein